MAQALQTSPADPAELTQAFAVFNELSSQLTEAYGQLEAQVAQLNGELSASRDARRREVAQKERLADRLGKLLEALPAAVVLVDGRDRVDRFNPAAAMLFPPLAWGRRWTEIRAEQVQAELSSGDWLLEGGTRVTVSRRPLNDRGEILVVVDVTGQRRLQERLERRDRLAAMGEMAAQLAHQVRTPLSTAMLYAGQLARSGLSDAQRRQFSDRLLAGLGHTEALVGDMLSFSRGGNYLPQAVSLQDILDGAVATVGPRLQRDAACFEIVAPGGTEQQVLGNREALASALANLFDNALQIVPEGLHLQVSVTPAVDHVAIRVGDNGPGIAADVARRIFDPFFTTRPRGTGLGLAVVQNVVLEHAGSLRAGHSPLGGAEFEIILPLAERPGQDGSAQQ